MVELTDTAASASSKPLIEVVRATDAHADALAAFFRAVWNPQATGADVRAARAATAAANPVEPGAEIPAFVFLIDRVVVGYITTIPMRLWSGVDGVERPGHWMKGFMVLPEHRNGPVGFAVLKEALRALDLTAVMTVAPPSLRLFQAMGFVDRGALGNYVRVLRTRQMLTRLDPDALGVGPSWLPRLLRVARWPVVSAVAGTVGDAALSLWAAAGSDGWAARRLVAGGQPPTRGDIDALWREARTGLDAAPVRDGAYWQWRYPSDGDGAYVTVAIRRGPTLMAIAAIRPPRADGDPRLRGVRVATLSDVLFHPEYPEAGRAVLVASERAAREMGADALLCSASHPALVRLLRRRAYVPLTGTVHFLLRDRAATKESIPALDNWWLTRGDANSDDAL